MKFKVVLADGNEYSKNAKSLVLTKDIMIVDGQILYTRGDGILELKVEE